MQEKFNIEKETERILILKKEVKEKFKQLNKYGITLEDILKELEDKSNE